MGWGNNVFPFLIVVGTSGGVFVYDSSGKLVDSMAALAGVDPLTKSNLPGVVSYGPFNAVSQLNSGFLALGDTTDFGLASLSAAGGIVTLDSGRLDAPDNPAGLSLQSADSPGGPVMKFSGFRAWYAPSGGDDFANLTALFAAGFSVELTPGTFQLSAQLTVTHMLKGADFSTIIKPFGAYAGSLLAVGAKGSIRNLSVQSSGADAITVAGGIAEWWLEDLNFASNAGWCINATITGPAHGRIRGIRGQGGGAANGGGINLNGGNGGSVTAEVNLSDIDIQNLQANPVLQCSAVTDIRCVGPFNGSVASGVAASCILIRGACQSIDLGSIDVGGGAAAGVLVIQDNGGSSPSEIDIGPGVVQSGGGAGVIVSGGAARIQFDRLMSKRNQGDGWLWSGTGGFCRMAGCGGNLNNQAAGTAYDIEVTSTVHLLNDGFKYVSGGVTAGRNLTIAGNHYTEANPPAALTFAGNAPAGW